MIFCSVFLFSLFSSSRDVNVHRYCRWAQMIIAKHRCLRLVHLIRISRFLIWLETQRYWLKNIGNVATDSHRQFCSPNTNWMNFFGYFFTHREKLCAHLPARAEGYSWSLVFSTSQNGFSLNSLYRKLQRIESPILIVIQDTDNNVSIEYEYYSLMGQYE